MARTHRVHPSIRRSAAAALSLLLATGVIAAGATTAAAAPEPGGQSSGDAMFPNVGNGGYDALDYDVRIRWSPTGTSGSVLTGAIQATTTMTAAADGELSSFSLDFEGLQVDAVVVNGVPATWERIVDPATITYKLVVTPAAPVTGTFTTMVAYSGSPVSHTDLDGSSEGWNATTDGATMLGQPIGSMTGFPHNNTPSDKATYTFTLDVPTTITNAAGTGTGPAAAVSNGELLSRTPSEDGTRTTWVWDQQLPMASELAIISIGRYDVIETTVELSDGSTIPSWSFMDSGLSTANKTTITNRVAQLGEIIRNLETMYGPYPGNSTGVVVDSVPGGVSYALETQDRSFFPSTSSVAGSTLIHELVHQWYGNAVAPTTWTDIWIGEGMATWGPSYYASTEAFGTGALSAEQRYFNSWNGAAASSSAWSIAPGVQTDSAELYGYQTYTRGAQFWAALRVAIGDDAFFALIEQWQTRYTGTSQTGADLLALAEELSGRDLAAFYQDWILDADKPAWPDKVDVTLAADAPEGSVARGDEVTYTLSAVNTGYVPLNATVVEVDVASLLEKAEIDGSALPDGVTLEGTTLTWQVPVTAPGAATPGVEPAAPPVTTSFTATVLDDASGGTAEAIAEVASLGGTCVDCVVTLDVEEYPVEAATPVVEGTPQVGEVLTAVTDGWTEGTTFTYEWLVDGEPVGTEPGDAAAADAPTFTVPESALDAYVSVTVTGSAEGYLPESRTSDEVGPVIAAPIPSPEPSEPAPSEPGPSAPAPSVSAPAPSAPAPTADADDARGSLPQTGADVATDAILWAFALLAAGAAVTLAGLARRRRG